MTTRHQVEIETLTLVIAAAVVGTLFAFYSNKTPKNRTVFNLPVMQTQTVQQPTISPIPTTETFSQITPDGRQLLTMKVTNNKDKTKTYVFTTSDASGNNQQTIYTVTFAKDTMSIPFNTWSPDNKFLFVNHNSSSGTEAWVFRANGQPMSDTEQYYNALPLFVARNTGNSYQEVTGWASETLLIINTTRPDGTKGPSYWLEIPSKAIIQLATEF